MTLPLISFEANLVDEPELRFTNNGLAIATVRVASTERKKDDSGKWTNGETTYLRLNVFREQAENVAESLHKGDTVVVIGRYRSRGWEDKEGNKRTSQEVDVDSIGLSLRWESFDSAQNKSAKNDHKKSNVIEDDPWASAPF